jgi:hypothetical protein
MSPAAAEEFGIILTSLLTLGIAVSVAIAILRHRLYNLDLVINRTLVYASLTTLVAALYVLVVGGLGVLLEARGSLALSLVGVGLVAIVAQPVRDRLQRAVNRLMPCCPPWSRPWPRRSASPTSPSRCVKGRPAGWPPNMAGPSASRCACR